MPLKIGHKRRILAVRNFCFKPLPQKLRCEKSAAARDPGRGCVPWSRERFDPPPLFEGKKTPHFLPERVSKQQCFGGIFADSYRFHGTFSLPTCTHKSLNRELLVQW